MCTPSLLRFVRQSFPDFAAFRSMSLSPNLHRDDLNDSPSAPMVAHHESLLQDVDEVAREETTSTDHDTELSDVPAQASAGNSRATDEEIGLALLYAKADV